MKFKTFLIYQQKELTIMVVEVKGDADNGFDDYYVKFIEAVHNLWQETVAPN
jgi:hypothetical protein